MRRSYDRGDGEGRRGCRPRGARRGPTLRRRARAEATERPDLYAVDASAYGALREERMVHFLDEFFWKCFFMLHMNRVGGDYLEFGSGSHTRSFRLAYKYWKLEYRSPRLFAFDSFEGLPEPTGIDAHAQWAKGAMAVPLDEFHARMRQIGAAQDEYTVVPGFYEDTLDKASPSDYGIRQAAMVFVDCDLYASSVSVLRFVKDVVADGCVLAFDDWYCFNGDPLRGEQRAFREFLAAAAGDVAVSEYLDFGWHGKSFIVHRTQNARRFSMRKRRGGGPQRRRSR